MLLHKNKLRLAVAMLLISACDVPADNGSEELEKIQIIDGVTFETGDWIPDLIAGQKGVSRGNHRAVVVIDSDSVIDNTEVVWAHIPWRRSDSHPEEKGFILVDAATDETVGNAVAVRIENESGDIVFQPRAGSNTYHVYYLPYETSGGYYPSVSYLPPTEAAESDWLNSLGHLSGETLGQLPKATTIRIQSINHFHSFVPMEIIATTAETADLLSEDVRAFYLFPEDRKRSIRMRSYLPTRWVERGLTDVFDGEARRGEYYTFQIGVFAPNQSLENVTVSFSDFLEKGGASIARTEFTCFNTGGIDELGNSFQKRLNIDEGRVQPLWIGVQIPDHARARDYRGTITISADQLPPQTIDATLRISRTHAVNRGDNNPEMMSRLRWLNSTIGTDPDFVIEPYVPVTVDERTLRILGRDILLGDTGLPTHIRSYFTPEMTGFSDEPNDILARPIDLVVRRGKTIESWTSEPFAVNPIARGKATWTTRSESEHFSMIVNGTVEYDGMLDYKIELVSKEDVDVSDIVLPISYQPDAAQYLLGLGFKGQKRPESIDWKWEIEKHQEGLWLGDINKGLQFVLRDQNYERPLNTNFYQTQPLNMPVSWQNSGEGGIRLETLSDQVIVRNYSGPRRMTPADTLHFNVRFLITPFKPLDTRSHFNTRFVHKYIPVDSVRALGGTVVNIHHANEINPYINYPFYNLDLQSAYIDEAHEKNIKVKLYNTIRELTYKSHELFALRSLGDEILNDGDGGGHSWLQEHLHDSYYSAWHAYRVDDAAILNKGTSRWTNYYIEGLNWLAEYQKIDGLYLDDIAFSRETVKRMMSVLHQHRNEVVIDLHSASQFNPRDGFINSAMLYMEHFPFISRLWFGEYFEYDADPDYWLTEVSGLPFGLMGEMLQDCGRPYRGMLYGMTTRYYGDCDPRPVWKMMGDFEIEDSRMLGYWLESSPVRTDHDRILATTFVRDGSTLIALASWSSDGEDIRLEIDWGELGIDPSSVISDVPAVEGIQPFRTLDLTEPIRIEKEQGLFIRLRRQ